MLITLLIISASAFAGARATDIARVSQAIQLDGFVRDKAWLHSREFSQFMQIEPTPGEKPSEETRVRILYDDDYLYVAVTAYDREPQKIMASQLEREGDIGSDDAIELIIDSYNGGTNAVAFKTNPLGARQDFEITDGNRRVNRAWDTFWDVETAVTDSGWNAEFRIPFTSLRFEEKARTEMGFKVVRTIRRKSETVMFPPVDPKLNRPQYRLQYTKKIILEGLNSKSPLYVTPYMIADYYNQYRLNDEQSAYKRSSDILSRKNLFSNPALDRLASNVGMDLKYGISKNITLDVTLNTDFAQAEADDRIINLTRYSVSFPEKRDFFLESNDLFSFRFGSTQIFYSRRIGIENGINVPILAGMRLTGKTNGYQIGLLNMQTKRVPDENINAHNFTVFRLTKEFGNDGSYIGGLFTNTVSTNTSQYNRLGGIDIKYRFDPQWYVSAKTAISFDDDLPVNKNYVLNFFLRKETTSGFEHMAFYSEIAPNFHAATGFLRYNNIRNAFIRNAYKWVFEGSKLFARLTLSHFQENIWTRSSGRLETFRTGMRARLKFMDGKELELEPLNYKRDYLPQNWQINDGIVIPFGEYEMYESKIKYATGRSSNHNGSLAIGIAGFYGGKRIEAKFDYRYIFSSVFKISGSYEFNNLSFPDRYVVGKGSSEFRSYLLRLKPVINFSSRWSLKMLFQYESEDDRIDSNIRLRYNPREGTDFFLVYNQGMNLDRYRYESAKPSIDNQTIIAKYSQTFNL